MTIHTLPVHTFGLPAGGHLAYRTLGHADAPALLLLHGFPQSHVLWWRVAQRLQSRFFMVMPDLRGYGDSFKPADEPEHAQMSKRVMAADMVSLMRALGHERFFLCGHDRGGRVSHRLALDHPDCVKKLCVLDIAPTLDMYAATDMAFARAYYHWFHLVQPAPLPERMIGADPVFYLHKKIGGWGNSGLAFSSPRPWLNTSAASPLKRCTPCAKTTAPRRVSIWSMTACRVKGPSKSVATCWCCGASAAWCTVTSSQCGFGRPSVPAAWKGKRCLVGTTFRKSSRQRWRNSWRHS
jgi:pimeloyl-ACP methyl ester carboxylesterase